MRCGVTEFLTDKGKKVIIVEVLRERANDAPIIH